MDFRTAFLNAPVDQLLYIELDAETRRALSLLAEDDHIPLHQRKSIKLLLTNLSSKDKGLRLLRALYGIKQAPRQWHTMIHNFLTDKLGFSANQKDTCIYSMQRNGVQILLLLYVDDILVASRNSDAVQWTGTQLANKFKIKKLGFPKLFLGVDIKKEDGRITMSLDTYLTPLLDRFNLTPNPHVGTPLSPGYYCDDTGEAKADEVLYRHKLGVLLWAAIVCKPEALYAATYLGRFNSRPTVSSVKELDRAVLYLYNSRNKGITLGGRLLRPIAYCDSDFASDQMDRKSVSGFCIYLGDGPVSWQSKKQDLVALSSCESEFVAMSLCCQTLMWLVQLLENNLSFKFKYSSTIWCDNASAIALLKPGVANRRTKHIDIRFHFARDCQEKGLIKVLHIPGNQNCADLLTKPVKKCIFQDLLPRLLGERATNSPDESQLTLRS